MHVAAPAPASPPVPSLPARTGCCGWLSGLLQHGRSGGVAAGWGEAGRQGAAWHSRHSRLALPSTLPPSCIPPSLPPSLSPPSPATFLPPFRPPSLPPRSLPPDPSLPPRSLPSVPALPPSHEVLRLRIGQVPPQQPVHAAGGHVAAGRVASLRRHTTGQAAQVRTGYNRSQQVRAGQGRCLQAGRQGRSRAGPAGRLAAMPGPGKRGRQTSRHSSSPAPPQR